MPISDLHSLLSQMHPSLDPVRYVYCMIEPPVNESILRAAVATVREREGVTVVLPQAQAGELACTFACRRKRYRRPVAV